MDADSLQTASDTRWGTGLDRSSSCLASVVVSDLQLLSSLWSSGLCFSQFSSPSGSGLFPEVSGSILLQDLREVPPLFVSALFPSRLGASGRCAVACLSDAEAPATETSLESSHPPSAFGAILANAFWFGPFLLGTRMPPVPWSAADFELHLTYAGWQRFWDDLWPYRFPIGVLLGFCIVHGFRELARSVGSRVASCFAISAGFVIFLKLFGSFLPFFVKMQPIRFVLPALALIVFPLGFCLAKAVGRLGMASGPTVAGLAVLLAVTGVSFGKPEPIPVSASLRHLTEFVSRNTKPQDRLLIQTEGFYETKALPLALGREVIGNSFPEVRDPAQFLRKTLWGKAIASWKADDLRSTLQRWGVTWVFTRYKEAHALFRVALGQPEQNVGDYLAFRLACPCEAHDETSPLTSGCVTRFLKGKGRVGATVNRFDLTDLVSDGGMVVLRYRFHPAWKTDTGIPVLQYPMPEDPVGFIALRNPPEAVSLIFDSWAMLKAEWPQVAGTLALSRQSVAGE